MVIDDGSLYAAYPRKEDDNSALYKEYIELAKEVKRLEARVKELLHIENEVIELRSQLEKIKSAIYSHGDTLMANRKKIEPVEYFRKHYEPVRPLRLHRK